MQIPEGPERDELERLLEKAGRAVGLRPDPYAKEASMTMWPRAGGPLLSEEELREVVCAKLRPGQILTEEQAKLLGLPERVLLEPPGRLGLLALVWSVHLEGPYRRRSIRDLIPFTNRLARELAERTQVGDPLEQMLDMIDRALDAQECDPHG